MLPDRLLAVVAILLCLLGFSTAPTRGDDSASDRERLDRIERRLDALEKRLDAGGAPPSAPAPGAPASAPARRTEFSAYLPGAVAVVHPAPTNPRLLSEVPPDGVGGFIYTGGPLTFQDLSGRGVRYTGLVGIELQGWLKVTATGRTQFDEDLHVTLGGQTVIGPECAFRIWLEDRDIGTERGRVEVGASREARLSLLLGADLQPGLYKLRLWTACLPAGNPHDLRVTTDLLVKGTNDLNLRSFKGDELLHQP